MIFRSSARPSVNAAGPGLQNQGRFDFVDILVLHGRNAAEASSHRNALRPEFLATPRPNDQIRFTRDHLLSYHTTVLACALVSMISEDLDAAGDFDKLKDQSNSREQLNVPFLNA